MQYGSVPFCVWYSVGPAAGLLAVSYAGSAVAAYFARDSAEVAAALAGRWTTPYHWSLVAVLFASISRGGSIGVAYRFLWRTLALAAAVLAAWWLVSLTGLLAPLPPFPLNGPTPVDHPVWWVLLGSCCVMLGVSTLADRLLNPYGDIIGGMYGERFKQRF